MSAMPAAILPLQPPSPGDTDPMPGRFERDRSRDGADDSAMVDASLVERNAMRLERVKDDLGDMRVSMTSLAGDVRTLVMRLERHDADHLQGQVESSTTGADIERRLRALERRSYAIPGLSALLGIAGFGVAVWSLIAGGHI